jgi:hypothetical protein
MIPFALFLPLDAPSAPVLTGVNNEDFIGLSWTNVAAESGYAIYRKLSSESDYVHIASVNGEVLTYDDESVEWGFTYDYYVVAYNAKGKSANSNVQSVLSEEL